MIKSMGRGIARGEGHGGRVSIMLAGYGGGRRDEFGGGKDTPDVITLCQPDVIIT